MNEEKKLRCWYTSNAFGVYLGAVGVVFAYDKRSAKKALQAKMTEVNAKNGDKDTDFDLHELPIGIGAHVLWDGDY